MTNNKYAAIDLGSNSCRLTIEDDEGTVLYKEGYPTKLAEGLFSSGKLSEEAMQRAIEVFEIFAEKIKEHNIISQNVRAIATAACRSASNTADLQKKIKEKTGLNLEIITEKEEAELNLLGGIKTVLGKSKYVILYDLGGASTEITLATNASNPVILHSVSIPWGARNATEAFGTNDNNQAREKLKQAISDYVDKFIVDAEYKKYALDDISFVATSSTPLRLSSLIFNDYSYDRDACDRRVFSCKDADKVIAKILATQPSELAKDERIGENRAPIFAAACIIFQTIYQKLDAKNITTSLASAQEEIIRRIRSKNNG